MSAPATRNLAIQSEKEIAGEKATDKKTTIDALRYGREKGVASNSAPVRTHLQ
jgi:hypothetical protein